MSDICAMKTALINFPGSNRDRDMIKAIKDTSGLMPTLVWHKETKLPKSDIIIIPGGFSYGDYLRAGAIAARSPIMQAIKQAANDGVKILGVCNGFQILTEAGLLPGTLMRNKSLKFICKSIKLEITNSDTSFTSGYKQGQVIDCPVAHHDGNFFADERTLSEIEKNNQVAFRYANGTNPNGSLNDIAGVFNKQKNVLGMMPHPENLIEKAHGGTDGRALFAGLFEIIN